MSKGSFSAAIADHLELQRRNCRLEPSMPIEDYRQAATPASSGPDQPTQPVSVRDPASWWEEQEGTEPKFNWE